MKITIEMDCDNDSFQGDEAGNEIATILREIGDGFAFCTRDAIVNELTNKPMKHRDGNGNFVATVIVKDA